MVNLTLLATAVLALSGWLSGVWIEEDGPVEWTLRTLVPLSAAVALAGAVVLIARLRPRAVAVLGVIAFAVLVAVPVGYAVYLTHLPARSAVADADLGARKQAVTLTTEHGVKLRGWWVPSRNGAAVAVYHGTGGSRASVVGHARLLARHGYGVLLMDLHGHGESGGRSTSVGWDAGDDLRAAAGFLESRVDRFGVIGVSLGGEAAIQALPDEPRFGAAVLEGVQGMSASDPLSAANLAVLGAAASVLSGSRSHGAPGELIERIAPRPVLALSAGEGNEARVGEEMRAHGAELWNLPEARHAAALRTDPSGYERRVVGFLDRALAG